MNLYNYIKNFFIDKKRINVNILPSQGFFYEEDFYLYVKKAPQKDIDFYEKDFVPGDLGIILSKIKTIVSNNIITNYEFEDIKSIDVIFIFFEIIKFTKNKPFKVVYFDIDSNKREIEFSSKYFNYYDFDSIKNKWNKINFSVFALRLFKPFKP